MTSRARRGAWLLVSLSTGDVPEAIALFNANAMSSQWFVDVYGEAAALGITLGRLRFAAGDPGQPFSSPATGSVLVYFGPNKETFAREFRKHCTILSVDTCVLANGQPEAAA